MPVEASSLAELLLIERIARLEAQNKALLEALTGVARKRILDGSLCWCDGKLAHRTYCTQARAAIEQAKEQHNGK